MYSHLVQYTPPDLHQVCFQLFKIECKISKGFPVHRCRLNSNTAGGASNAEDFTKAQLPLLYINKNLAVIGTKSNIKNS